MHDSKFWRIVAVSFVVALFYVGHGLHNRSHDGLSSLISSAHAGGVAVQETGGTPPIYTTNAAGTQLFLWKGDGAGRATCVGVASFDGPFRERNHDSQVRTTVPSEGPRGGAGRRIPGGVPDPLPRPAPVEVQPRFGPREAAPAK